jgi:hypothetical protein
MMTPSAANTAKAAAASYIRARMAMFELERANAAAPPTELLRRVRQDVTAIVVRLRLSSARMPSIVKTLAIVDQVSSGVLRMSSMSMNEHVFFVKRAGNLPGMRGCKVVGYRALCWFLAGRVVASFTSSSFASALKAIRGTVVDHFNVEVARAADTLVRIKGVE